MRRPDARWLPTSTGGALWLAATLWLTLRTVPQVTPVPFWSFFTEVMASADYAQNVVLFLPLGWIARRGGWRLWRVALAGLLVSGSIELLQQWVSGRTSQASDILLNTSGAALGWWMAAYPDTESFRGRRIRLPLDRLVAAFVTLGCLMGLHVLNTTWPTSPARGDGSGAWTTIQRNRCSESAMESTICLGVPNTAEPGAKYLRVVGLDESTFARVQSNAYGRKLGPADCVLLQFENTIGARMHLRPPLVAACGVADTLDPVILLQVNPRLEHEMPGAWTPTRASVWMWPIWPFSAYQPLVQVAAAAVTFVVLVSLVVGAASWVVPAGYLAMLEVVAVTAGMRTPGWWEVAAAAFGWLMAAGAVRVDRWWNASNETPAARRAA